MSEGQGVGGEGRLGLAHLPLFHRLGQLCPTPSLYSCTSPSHTIRLSPCISIPPAPSIPLSACPTCLSMPLPYSISPSVFPIPSFYPSITPHPPISLYPSHSISLFLCPTQSPPNAAESQDLVGSENRAPPETSPELPPPEEGDNEDDDDDDDDNEVEEEAVVPCPDPNPVSEALCEEDLAGDRNALDAKDPNRPRFTLQELRDVLHERNELKAKVFMLQEEIAYYRSEDPEDETGPSTPSPSPIPRASPRPNAQPESGIKRLVFLRGCGLREAWRWHWRQHRRVICTLLSSSPPFSFFSRDKRRSSQRNVQLDDSFGSWAGKDDVYTEQAQEALQHCSGGCHAHAARVSLYNSISSYPRSTPAIAAGALNHEAASVEQGIFELRGETDDVENLGHGLQRAFETTEAVKQAKM
ncbi:hypothetical protein JZ751_015991 [Albula glossodonta]|uniref:RH2 domain-containing protein n=1 Tax=Albula glossodonta TaxID=121402 RepID=A0A8T2NYR1_9TELE|nr:hypothetical protein JZ751_015991 [Albula glossodonta]